ncbi:VanZ family protein [Marilutibacter chinensis]|uniref:VanZ family protein n=1 Tax=Marilutibacter chinensis TaxID=2912247 RepID=A0ABS9HTB1_9GAMM|nr:VanZ family protein [Lysobacter chinensis]MCF7222144.1 VanZ family protein [Lysobacter chinensis]
MRGFRRPALWLAAWSMLVALVIAASLLPARELPPAPFDGIDKLEHFLAYAVLAAGAVMLFARRGVQLLLALALVALGIGLEFAQGALTASRQADGLDALANTLGVLVGWSLGWTPARLWLLGLDARLP